MLARIPQNLSQYGITLKLPGSHLTAQGLAQLLPQLVLQFKEALEKGNYKTFYDCLGGGGVYRWSASLKRGKGYSNKLVINAIDYEIYEDNTPKSWGGHRVLMRLFSEGGLLVDIDPSGRILKMNGNDLSLESSDRDSLIQAANSLADLLFTHLGPKINEKKEEDRRFMGIKGPILRIQKEGYYTPQDVTIETFKETFSEHFKHFKRFIQEKGYLDEEYIVGTLSFQKELIWPIIDDLRSPRFSKIDKKILDRIIGYIERLIKANRINLNRLKAILLFISQELGLNYCPIDGFDPIIFSELSEKGFELKVSANEIDPTSLRIEIRRKGRTGEILAYFDFDVAEGRLSTGFNESGIISGEDPAFKEIADIFTRGLQGYDVSSISEFNYCCFTFTRES